MSTSNLSTDCAVWWSDTTVACGFFFPSLYLSLWGECCPEKKKWRNSLQLLFFSSLWVHSRKKLVPQSLFILFFNSDFVLWHLKTTLFSSLFCANLRSDEVWGLHFSAHYAVSERGEREIKTEVHTLNEDMFNVSPFVPIVTTVKMMTATPSSIARQLNSIDRRPYFRAPAMSPVWRTVLD